MYVLQKTPPSPETSAFKDGADVPLNASAPLNPMIIRLCKQSMLLLTKLQLSNQASVSSERPAKTKKIPLLPQERTFTYVKITLIEYNLHLVGAC